MGLRAGFRMETANHAGMAQSCCTGGMLGTAIGALVAGELLVRLRLAAIHASALLTSRCLP